MDKNSNMNMNKFCNGWVRLGVNVDHVATLRQNRHTRYPDPLHAALLAEEAGADGITVHLREDRRHIQPEDVIRMKEVLVTPLNLEMAVTDEMVEFAMTVRPANICLVPEKRAELTTEGGLDIILHKKKIKEICLKFQEDKNPSMVSLFIDPDLRQIDAVLETGAKVIELHTGAYADAVSKSQQEAEYQKILKAAAHAIEHGLIVNAGHGLHYHNVRPIAKIHGMHELNIGHAIVARAIFVGMKEAVKEMKALF